MIEIIYFCLCTMHCFFWVRVITHLNGFYPNFCSCLKQVNGFHLYSCKHTTFCMWVKCYQCDKILPNTQPEGTGNNPAVWLLSELLFTHRVGEWF